MKCSKLLSCSFAFGPILATSAASESTRGQDQEAGGPDARKTSWTSGDRSLSTLPRLQATLSSQLSHELRTFTVHYASEISSLRVAFPFLPFPSLSFPCLLASLLPPSLLAPAPLVSSLLHQNRLYNKPKIQKDICGQHCSSTQAPKRTQPHIWQGHRVAAPAGRLQSAHRYLFLYLK